VAAFEKAKKQKIKKISLLPYNSEKVCRQLNEKIKTDGKK
jgi:hypothetical protein